MLSKSKITKISISCFLALALLIPYSPLFQRIPGRDSGVFAYIGNQMISGAVPYRDIWDHKPPIIYIINLIGKLISQSDMWGIWLMQLLFTTLTFTLVFVLLKQFTSNNISLGLSIFIGLISFTRFIDGGNLTEQYALLFQCLGIYIFLRLINRSSVVWGFAFGTLIALSLLTKQTSIGIFIAGTLLILYTHFVNRSFNLAFKQFVTISSGFILIITLFTIYFIINNGVYEFVDQAFLYNLHYSQTSNNKLYTIFYLFKITLPSGILLFALLGWLKLVMAPKRNKLYLLLILSLPIELILVSLSGKQYPHYFITLLPSLVLLSAVSFEAINKAVNSRALYNYKFLFHVLTTIMVFIASVLWLNDLMPLTKVPPIRGLQEIQDIRENSSDTDGVLVWGAETSYLLMANRRSPTKYIYSYPLITSGYTQPHHISELLSTLQTLPPKIIVDTSSSNLRIPPLEGSILISWRGELTQQGDATVIIPFTSWVSENYTPIETAGRWQIYKRNY